MIIKRQNLQGVPAFARQYGINIKTVTRLIERNQLTAESIEGRLFIRLDLLQRSADQLAAEGRYNIAEPIKNFLSVKIRQTRR